ncbi:MAG: Holliday junction branch migration protein RuvA [Nitrospinota bacterium]
MIARITGKIIFKSPDYIIVDVNGIGYQVFVPLSTYYELPDIGDSLDLHIYTHVREDMLRLYGFLKSEEHHIFEQLISVSSIGPKMALNILSRIRAGDLREAIGKGDILKLNSIPGIGKKTAERIVIELKDKIGYDYASSIHFLPGNGKNNLTDTLSALINLGYKKGVAERVVRDVWSELGDDASVEELIKESLKVLSK